MTRPTRAYINTEALRHNLRRVRQLSPQSQVMSVVKADAYGHGLVASYQGLRDSDAFAVATVEEGVALRALCDDKPIVILSAFLKPAEIDILEEYRLSPVVHDSFQIGLLEDNNGYRLDVWLKIDTGMNRLGVRPEEVAECVKRLQKLRGIASIGLMSHAANADDPYHPLTVEQIRCFEDATAPFSLAKSFANSGLIYTHPECHYQWVRPGIMLYGISPLQHRVGKDMGLLPAMSFRSEIIAVKTLAAGHSIGYGSTWSCDQADIAFGVVACGYGDGYPRHAETGTPLWVEGRQCPIIGRVSMDTLTVDLTHCQAAIGTPVELWGDQLPVETVAHHSQGLAYELVTKVTGRVPRIAADGPN